MSNSDIGESCEAPAISKILNDTIGFIPHVIPLVEAIGLFGLEPRVRQLATIAVARTGHCASILAFHRLVGKAAGLTEAERAGLLDGLTAAELSAVELALGTVSRPLPIGDGDPVDSADQHFTSSEIRQIQAVALATEIDCQIVEATTSFIGRISSRR